ncbi:MAG: hypothetical protein EOO24_51260 [Comamonadaceae bacterium]|nr:MAG: hypothetical protein EOO24_51260 [Comamonadaceae bacterium]
MKGKGSAAAEVAIGFGLSFLAMGLLWIAMAWAVQAAMALVFGAAAWWRCRRAARPGRSTTHVLLGAAPLGLLFVQFRDPAGSHLLPLLMVALWVVGAVAGMALATRGQRDEPGAQAGE